MAHPAAAPTAFALGQPLRRPGRSQVRDAAASRSCARTRRANTVAVLSVPPSLVTNGAAPPIDVYNRILEATRVSGRVQVVMFHADHCRSCKATKGKFVDLMEAKTDADYGLVNLTGDGHAADRLGITNLPTFHIYAAKGDSVGLLDEFQCGGFGCAQRVDKRLGKLIGNGFDINDYDF